MFSFFTSQKNTQSRIYLDHAGASPLGSAAEKELIKNLSLFGNPSAIHREGDSVSKVFDKARNRSASVLNAHAYEIFFTGSGTESCNLAILGAYEAFAKSQKPLASGVNLPHIITTTIEHPAVLEPIKYLEKNGKITVTYLPVDERGIVNVNDVEEAITDKTILISVMYANNEIGTLQPVKEIGRFVEEWKKSHGRTHTEYPYIHTDACQAANYCNLDVVRLRVHLMTVNSGKVYGPKGIALLYKREGVHLEPITYGGGQERGLRSGTESVALAAAFSVALDEAASMREKESVRLREIRDVTVTLLKQEIPEIIFYGAFDQYHTLKTDDKVLKHELRLPNNINCRIPGITSEEMILRLDAKGFAVSHKSACASMETDGSYVVRALGATEQEALENIRISMGRSTTMKDMKQLIVAMKETALKYKKVSSC